MKLKTQRNAISVQEELCNLMTYDDDESWNFSNFKAKQNEEEGEEGGWPEL